MQISGNSFNFVSTVPSRWRPAVEALFFFNPRQQLVREGIRLSVELHGRPELLESDGRLWIGTRSGAMQCLFAQDRSREPNRIAGVTLYLRTDPEVLSIAHLAVDPDYASGGSGGGDGIGLMLIDQVRQIARRINGIRHVQLPYSRKRYLSVSGSRLR